MGAAAAMDPVQPSARQGQVRAVPVPENLAGPDRHAALLAAARDGDKSAMTQLIGELTPLVWHVARGNGCERDQAEVIVQNTWLALLRQLDNIRESRALAGWLITTARRETQRLRQGESRTGPLTDELAETVSSSDPAPDEQALRAERDRRLWRAFTKLSKRDQELLRLLVMNKNSHKDVAKMLGLSVGSVGPTRGRAVERLRKLLDDEEATHPVDAALVDRLRAAGFTGPEFDQFAERVIAHAQPLVRTWITTGDIFRKATRAGRTMLRMPENLTADEAEDLARDTVFTAWTTLVTDLEQHRWTPDTALNDHYLDLCVRAFPPIYHAHLKNRRTPKTRRRTSR